MIFKYLIVLYEVVIYIYFIFFSFNIYFNFYFKEEDDFKVVEIEKDIYFVSCYYDIRFKAFRLILYNNSNYIPNFSCVVFYYMYLEYCNLKLYPNLSEEHTVMNLLIFVKTIPFKFKLNNHYIWINRNKVINHSRKNKITVCIGKMINFTAYNMLIQMIESYLYFGVDKFVVYKTSSSKSVDKVLNYYKENGLLDIINWDKKFDIKYAKYKTYGQRIKLNDCFYRCFYQTEGIIMTDLDEILWPNTENNIITMIENLEKKENKKYDVYIFQEKIFKRNSVEYNDRYIHNIEDCDIFNFHLSCDYTWKWPKLYIKNLSKITAVSIHWITGYMDNYKEKKVTSNIGFIRHTRRIYPYITKGLIGNWSFYNSDYREYIINNHSKFVKKRISKIDV